MNADVMGFETFGLSAYSSAGRLEGLVIDDKARALAAELNADPQLNGVLHFDALELKPGAGIIDELCAGLARIRAAKLSYGFVLPGLWFGEGDGEYFSGYLLLPCLRRYLPTSAVIVYSPWVDVNFANIMVETRKGTRTPSAALAAGVYDRMRPFPEPLFRRFEALPNTGNCEMAVVERSCMHFEKRRCGI